MKLQDLRRKIYKTAKSERQKRFWGLYCHVIKLETLERAYKEAKANGGAAGIDGVTFGNIEIAGAETFINGIAEELKEGTYRPKKNRKVQIPKANGKMRTLGIPTIKDRVVQGALKLILEPIFEADFSEDSYGYRPNKSQHDAVIKVSQSIMRTFTTVIDVDLTAFFDNVDHEILMKKIQRRVNDPKIMRLLYGILKAGGTRAVPQGGVISPLLSNIYLNCIDKMFANAISDTKHKGYEQLAYCRFADDIVITVNGHKALKWLVSKAYRRLSEELSKLKINFNTEKTKIVDLAKGETFTFLGFEYRLIETENHKMVKITPKKEKVKALRDKIRNVLTEGQSLKLKEVIKQVNDIVRGWVNYYRIGHCSKTFGNIRQWIELKVRRYQRKKQKRFGFGWKEWSKEVIYNEWGLYNDYAIRYYNLKAESI
jgi:group II intron reverse transcriptase/maturase